MKIAIIHDNQDVFISFEHKRFKYLLEKYFEETKDIGKALDKIEEDLRQETKYI